AARGREGRAGAEDDLDQVLHGAGRDAAGTAERAVHPRRRRLELPQSAGRGSRQVCGLCRLRSGQCRSGKEEAAPAEEAEAIDGCRQLSLAFRSRMPWAIRSSPTLPLAVSLRIFSAAATAASAAAERTSASACASAWAILVSAILVRRSTN